MTTLTSFELMCALLSSNAYQEGRIDANRTPLPPGATVLPGSLGHTVDIASGFEAAAVRYGEKIVIAFAGTDPATIIDIQADAYLGLGKMHRQLQLAAKFYKDVQAHQQPGEEIVFTGHSLGGGLASLMAVFFDRQAVVFDPAPFRLSATQERAGSLRQYLANLGYADAPLAAYSSVEEPLVIARPTIYATLIAGGLALKPLFGPVGPAAAAAIFNYANRTQWPHSMRGQSNVTAYAVRGEFLTDGFAGTGSGFLNDIRILAGSEPRFIEVNASVERLGLDKGVKLHSIQLLVALAHVPQLVSLAQSIPELLPAIFDKALYARLASDTEADFLNKLLTNEFDKASSVSGNGCIAAWVADLDKLMGNTGIAQTQVRGGLLSAAIEYRYLRTTPTELFTAVDGRLSFKWSDIGAAHLKSLPRLAAAVEAYLPTEERLYATYLLGKNAWHIQQGSGQLNWSETEPQNDAVVGGVGVDIVNAGAGADIVFGNAGVDALNGGAGNDILLGGLDIDFLNGGDADAGNDLLLGGASADIYQFTGAFGHDIIDDSDGQGEVKFNGTYLPAGKKLGDNHWQSDDGAWTYVFAPSTTGSTNGTLYVLKTGGADTITIRNYTLGGFGIALSDTPAAPPTTTATFDGEFFKAVNGDSYVLIPTGYASAGPSTNTPDVINGTAGADKLTGGDGNDGISGQDGDDVIEGGDGADLLAGGFGVDTISGGAGDDHIHGSAVGTINAPTAVNFTPPASSGVEIARGFSWVIFNPPGLDGNGQDTDTLAGTTLRQGYVQGGGGFTVESTGNVIDGGAGNDRIFAGSGADRVFGGADNDVIWGMGSGDVLYGEAGADDISGDGSPFDYFDYTPPQFHGRDVLFGGQGNDTLRGQGGDDDLYGGTEDDHLWGDDTDPVFTPVNIHGIDFLSGGDGTDQLVGGGNNDTLYGGPGNDAMWGDDFDTVHTPASVHGVDLLEGQDGADQLVGGGKDDKLYGGDGDDQLIGDDKQDVVPVSAHGSDYLDGGAGADLLVGSGGDDALNGGDGNDQLQGDDASNNVAESAHGVDWLDGGAGNDTLIGGGNDDTLIGDDGDDVLSGDGDAGYVAVSAHGADRLEGGAGNDALRGDGGNDVLIGGAGTDSLAGGAGDDTYVLAFGDGPVTALDEYEGIDDYEGINTVSFGAGIAPEALQFAVDASGRNFTIGYSATDRLVVLDGLGGTVRNYAFADGTSVSFSELVGRYSPTVLRGQSELGFARALGGLGDDTISTVGGLAILSGGRGNDILSAFGGNNTYRFSLGDERDSIEDHSGTDPASGQPWATSRIVFGSGIRPESITLSHSGALVFTFGADSTDELRVVGFNPANALAAPNIDQYVFDDGTVLTHAQVLARGFDLVGTAGDDSLSGTSVDDRFDGGAGNDTMTGGAGNDAYTWGPGAGIDVIDDGDATVGATDTLRVTAGLAPADLRLGRSGQDLVIAVRNGTEQVTVRNHFSNAGLEQITNVDRQQIVPSSAAANDPEWAGPTQGVYRTAGGAA